MGLYFGGLAQVRQNSCIKFIYMEVLSHDTGLNIMANSPEDRGGIAMLE